MKGLELSRRFYEEHGRGMLFEGFADLLPHIAVGLIGSGSECLGYDDELSSDHDFEPSFCIFLPDESIVDRRTAFLLQRAYDKLPHEFMGYKRSPVSPVGEKRHGVIRINDFLESKTGEKTGELSLFEWLRIPEQALLEATSGELFFDGSGELTRVRESLRHLPDDVRLKKLAGQILLMGQSGQYNYGRCLSRGEGAAAQLAIFEFVKSALSVFFLLEKRYMPYYKWAFRALRETSVEYAQIADQLEFLISSDNVGENANKKQNIIESICHTVSKKLTEQGIIRSDDTEMERVAYTVNDAVKDNVLRNSHVLSGV